ncbi:uncharacterized protein LOC122153432 [Tyto alba]|uniref:uncharacterized protein LOC122153432 n=1 Tax=Tyto alba TaxID=56313 RepID=UPI001C679E2B|nr:uncharacterized protein LOC122153432 [Tyto alba]
MCMQGCVAQKPRIVRAIKHHCVLLGVGQPSNQSCRKRKGERKRQRNKCLNWKIMWAEPKSGAAESQALRAVSCSSVSWFLPAHLCVPHPLRSLPVCFCCHLPLYLSINLPGFLCSSVFLVLYFPLSFFPSLYPCSFIYSCVPLPVLLCSSVLFPTALCPSVLVSCSLSPPFFFFYIYFCTTAHYPFFILHLSVWVCASFFLNPSGLFPVFFILYLSLCCVSHPCISLSFCLSRPFSLHPAPCQYFYFLCLSAGHFIPVFTFFFFFFFPSLSSYMCLSICSSALLPLIFLFLSLCPAFCPHLSLLLSLCILLSSYSTVFPPSNQFYGLLWTCSNKFLSALY